MICFSKFFSKEIHTDSTAFHRCQVRMYECTVETKDADWWVMHKYYRFHHLWLVSEV